MISIPPKPQSAYRAKSTLQRLPKRMSMTIALGMLCGNGAIIAADRRRCLPDGSSVYENKILRFEGPNISFAIADASDDADSAKALVRSIASRLGTATMLGWPDVETHISTVMTEWRSAFNQDAPITHLVAIILLKGFGLQLYFCKPPNVVLPKPEGYIAAGAGAAVTDSLANALFDPHPQSRPAQMVLRQIAYLMYRAKQDNAWCGGQIDAVHIDSRSETLEWVDVYDMRKAEETSFQLDYVLNMAATATLGGGQWLEDNAEAVSDLILRCSQIRDVVFHNIRGQEIGKT